MYAAQDRTGKYRGAVIATSKKGGSLKVMPVAAGDRTAFRALVLDLPALLAGKGRKAYLHHTPTSWEVAALQESGWRLEGQFPGHYREAPSPSSGAAVSTCLLPCLNCGYRTAICA